jgi:hypothetical protein
LRRFRPLAQIVSDAIDLESLAPQIAGVLLHSKHGRAYSGFHPIVEVVLSNITEMSLP